MDPVVHDKGIGPNLHNGKANLLRKGLGIMSFNILEDYIKDRTIEILNEISNSGIIFTNLPDKLIESSVLGSLPAIQTIAKRMKKNQDPNWLSTAIDNISAVASSKYSNTNYQLSHSTFFHSTSNIEAEQVGDVLASIGIDGQWPVLTEIARKFGFGSPDLRQTFVNMSSRRHSAAHESGSAYEYTWLTNIRSEILSIASAYDAALSLRVKILKANPGVKATKMNINSNIRVRYLYPKTSEVLQEKIDISAKSIKNWHDELAAINALKPQLNAKNEFLIVYCINQVTNAIEFKNWFY